ncbi:hypothetical protein LEP3755_65360 (plasmid) [Leptolyngbya sp. NIES-3755]|nr:hypothetical protein LEP3755_65360 [Leptolyngbya sp. NIES-3755]
MQDCLTNFQFVSEQQHSFFALFPHRYDFIWAEHAPPQRSVEWQTERCYPLSDRHINQGSYLYGVRFGAKTQYVMLDIDAGSAFHPKRDPFAIARIISSLEPLGLVDYLACTSSYSGGLHLYLPFEDAQSSWQLSIALSVLLENAGFLIQPGQLELFPNPKPYRNDGSFSLFNAHRLPLQIGSYLLNADFQPVWSDRTIFIQHWNMTRSRNTIDSDAIKRVLKQFRRHRFRISGKADKYLNDLNVEIELGWTGPGQTNRLLGRIAMRSYVFHHVTAGGTPLTGSALVDEIIRVSRSLPGYTDWCRHQHEIEHRAAEWARCVEASHYFHYGDAHGKYKAQIKECDRDRQTEELPNWNQQQSESARSKIRNAIADLLNNASLPSGATERFKKLLEYRIGGGSLYRHKDLWHPQFLTIESETSSITQQQVCVKNAVNASPSLLSGNGGNSSAQASCTKTDFITLPGSIDSETWQAVVQMAMQIVLPHQTVSTHQIERVQQYLASGDPILTAEALSWFQALQAHSASGRDSESLAKRGAAINSSMDSTFGQFCSSDLNLAL